MRHLPGTIALSEGRDYPILRLVLHSRVITHEQLFQLLTLESYGSSRNAFSNRVLRLVKHGLLKAHNTSFVGRVYSITTSGLAPLIRTGECYTLGPNEQGELADPIAACHAVEINDIRLGFRRTGLLVRWMPESRVRSRNELTNIGYLKDYDAILTLRLNQRTCEIALEYERTAKSTQHYAWIRKRMEAEPELKHFLYLCSNFDLMMFVANRFRGCRKRVYFGLLREFLKDPMNTEVIMGESIIQTPLASALYESEINENQNIRFAQR
jgi:hypothetical protein